MNRILPLWTLLLLLFVACKSTKKSEVFLPPVIINTSTVTDAVAKDLGNGTDLQSKKAPSWAPKDHGYKPSRTRSMDLLDTRLELSFDWENRSVIGKANMRLKPYFYPSHELVLDAKNLEVGEVKLSRGEEKAKLLSFENTGEALIIDLGKVFTRDDTFEISIDYIARPYGREAGGSAAITSDRGLYFINHDSQPGKPQQIWTQGEVQANSFWFPTIDSPNERSTQEMLLTVENRFLTVANGRKINSTSNGNGTRTDHWVQSIPHPPYLFALAIGEFAEVKDKWRDREVNYYVEKEYEAYAGAVFGNTPEMIEFYSELFEYDFPWDKYAQIVVRDFVTGAMENTGCVIFNESFQMDDREHLDEDKDDVIAHELVHQWFGDLVTCESWANLSLNEAFASYGEYLWFEHKYGKDWADHHLRNDLAYYLFEAASKREPIIRFGYDHPDDMFDRHSYQKGSCVLHLLRNEVGDEAFFTALRLYLKKHQQQSAEIHDLRLVFEEVTGTDLNWFFNQWFMSPGHPELKVRFEQEIDLQNTQATSRRLLNVEISQLQDQRYIPIFRLPVRMQIMFTDGSLRYVPVVLETEDTTFSIEVEKEVSHVIFDGEGVLIAEIDEELNDVSALVNQLNYGDHFRQKEKAILQLSYFMEQDAAIDAALKALKDPYWLIREEAILSLKEVEGIRKAGILKEFIRLGEQDPHPSVRNVAVSAFGGKEVIDFVKEKEFTGELFALLDSVILDRSYQVQASALKVVSMIEPEKALEMVERIKNEANPALKAIIIQIWLQSGEVDRFDQIMSSLKELPGGLDKITLVQAFGEELSEKSEEQKQAGLEFLMGLASEEPEWWTRLVAIQALESYSEKPEVQAFFTRQAELEKNPELKEYLKGL